MKSENKNKSIREFFRFTFEKRIFALLIFSEIMVLFLIIYGYPSTPFWELFWVLFIFIEFPLTIIGTAWIFLMCVLLFIIFLVINYFLASFIVRLCINIKKLRNPLIKKVSIDHPGFKVPDEIIKERNSVNSVLMEIRDFINESPSIINPDFVVKFSEQIAKRSKKTTSSSHWESLLMPLYPLRASFII